MTSQIRTFLKAMFSTLDPGSNVVWATINDSMTTAMFSAAGMKVIVRFSPLKTSCLVDYQITGRQASATEGVRSAVRVYDGVLQALRIFDRVHGPIAYRFAQDDEVLAELWEAYKNHPGSFGQENRRAWTH